MKYLKSLLCIVLAVCITGCRDTQNATATAKKDTLWTDDMNRHIRIPVSPQRIISLTPSITELLYAFSDTTHMVGRSVYCDYPEAVKQKPAVNSYPPDIEAIVALQPDVVFVKYGMIPLQDLDKLEKLHIQVFVQKYDRLSEIRHSTEMLIKIVQGDSVGLAQWNSHLIMQSKDTLLADKTFAVLASVQPIYVFGKQTFVSELMEEAGGRNIAADVKNAYPTLDVEQMLQHNPDILIFSSGITSSSLFDLYPVLKKMKAYKNNAVYTINESVLSRPGIRLPVLQDTLRTILRQ